MAYFQCEIARECLRILIELQKLLCLCPILIYLYIIVGLNFSNKHLFEFKKIKVCSTVIIITWVYTLYYLL